MKMNAVSFEGLSPVDGYGPGFFRFAGGVIEGGVIATADGVTQWAGLSDEAALLALAGQVDVLFLGLGADPGFAPAALRDALEAKGIGVEAMATPPACRSFNVTLAEGRRVALAALPV